MPWMFSPSGSMISTLFASLGIFVALVQTGWELIADRRITTNTCFLVFVIGVCITYGNYDYLTALSEDSGTSQQWSGLSRVPESLIEDDQYGKIRILKRHSFSGYKYPSIDNINSYVIRFQARFLFLCFSLLGAIAVIAFRKRSATTTKSVNDLIPGLPAIILGIGGLSCILAMAIG